MAFRRYGRSPRTISWVKGRRLRWYPDSVSVGNAWLFGLLEWPDMRFVCDVVQPGDLFVDVGANVGVYTLLATLTPEVDVLAFEPGRIARERLREHIGLNDLQGRVEISPVALSDMDGEVAFTVGGDVLNRVTEPSPYAEMVPARRLDHVLPTELGRGVVLKVDAEGHDLQVLAGAHGLLLRERPPIIVEWNNPAIRELLEPLGYSPHGYDPESRKLTRTDWTHSETSNVLMIADIAAVQARLAHMD